MFYAYIRIPIECFVGPFPTKKEARKWARGWYKNQVLYSVTTDEERQITNKELEERNRALPTQPPEIIEKLFG